MMTYMAFSCSVMTYKTFSDKKLSQAGQKTHKKQSSGIKSFCSNTPYGCLSKKMHK